MKFICLLFSVYILFLISLPCRDGVSCTDDAHVNQTTHNDQPDNSDHPDGCSPFCICACCSVSVVLNAFHFESTPYTVPVRVDFLLKECKPEKYFHSIWEPPKA